MCVCLCVCVCVHSGLFKTDKVVGSAQLKLEALENQCEIREIIDVSDSHKLTHTCITCTRALVSHEAVLPLQVLDGRKATGGKLEVRVNIREPLSGVQLQPVTEKWLVIDPLTPSPEKDREREKDRDREKSREKERV